MLSKILLKPLSVLCFCTGLIVSQVSYAALTVSPTRAVLDNKTRSMPIKLTNGGTTKTTYRISFKNMHMTEEGVYVDVDATKVKGQYAERMVRYAPRQISLEPGETQSIRLLLRKPKGLADGEYRSHLLFQEIPDEAGLRLNQILGDQKEDSLSVVLAPVPGVTIPVIVRQGKLEASVSMDRLTFKRGNKDIPSNVEFNLTRSGNRSVYGDLEVTHYVSGSKEGMVVGLVQGISILSPTKKRTISLQLDVPPKHQLQGGHLAVVYQDITGSNKKSILAESDIPLP